MMNYASRADLRVILCFFDLLVKCGTRKCVGQVEDVVCDYSCSFNEEIVGADAKRETRQGSRRLPRGYT